MQIFFVFETVSNNKTCLRWSERHKIIFVEIKGLIFWNIELFAHCHGFFVNENAQFLNFVSTNAFAVFPSSAHT